MLTRQTDADTYEVLIYDWVNLREDYIAGYVKRVPGADEESDLRYWMFHPAGGTTPLNARDLKNLSVFISKLNA